MHYLGLVLVENPTREAVEEAMSVGENQYWDWWRPGGRWDGWLDDKQEERATDNGFNFAEVNERVELNCRRVAELDPEKPPFFFVVDGDWIPKEYWNPWVKSPHGDYYGHHLGVPHFKERWLDALAKHPDWHAIVVDAHN